MPIRISPWKVAAVLLGPAVLALVGADYAKRFFGPTISPPSEYAEANLRVDIVVTRDRLPIVGYVIEEAGFSCPKDAKSTYSALLAPFKRLSRLWSPRLTREPQPIESQDRHSWCRIRSWKSEPAQHTLNLPLTTDSKGRATLWVQTDPAPHLTSVPLRKMRFYLARRRAGSKNDDTWDQHVYKPKFISSDHWIVHVDPPL